MPAFEIICLANSRKLSGRCIAGIRTDGGGWIRPVGETVDGTLYPINYTLDDGSKVSVLDVLKIEVIRPRPEPHQPENWLISNKTWKLVARPASKKNQRILWSHVVPGPALLGNQSDRISVATFDKAPAQASLALVTPDNVEWVITKSIKGKRQTRAVFNLSGVGYDLGVTDPGWEQHLSNLPLGNYSSSEVGLERKNRLLLTISLGEPFQGYCFKLVTSVLLIGQV